MACSRYAKYQSPQKGTVFETRPQFRYDKPVYWDSMSLKTPILFLVFNRPETTRRVFDAIKLAKPARLFVAADGPRTEIPSDLEKCERTRNILAEVDWDCQVLTLFREKNLGCRKAVSSAIDWFFENVEEGIVLEDDCLPSSSFFEYCQNLLEFYRHDKRVMQVCGLNVLMQWNGTGHSYFFSNYGPVWGWASWKRAWKYYDVDMKVWPEIRQNKIYEDFCQNSEEAKHRLDIYDKVYSREIDTWDYQWGFAKMINHGLSIIPSVNLISNIGFTGDATHTTSGDSPYSNMDVLDLCLSLDHPKYMIRDCAADMRYLNDFMGVKPAGNSLGMKLHHLLQRALKS